MFPKKNVNCNEHPNLTINLTYSPRPRVCEIEQLNTAFHKTVTCVEHQKYKQPPTSSSESVRADKRNGTGESVRKKSGKALLKGLGGPGTCSPRGQARNLNHPVFPVTIVFGFFLVRLTYNFYGLLRTPKYFLQFAELFPTVTGEIKRCRGVGGKESVM